LSTWLGLRWLSRPSAIRWQLKCASYSRRPLSLAAGIITLTVLVFGVSFLRTAWLARNFTPEVFGRVAELGFVSGFLARCLLPLLCIGFLTRWRKSLEAHSGLFWATSGWLLLYLCTPLFGFVELWTVLSWTALRPDSWQLGSLLYSSHYSYNEWDAILLSCCLATLLAILVLRVGSGLLRRPQRMILWATRHPILLGIGIVVAQICGLSSQAMMARSIESTSLGVVGLVHSLMSVVWVFVIPLVWGQSLRRLQGKNLGSAPAPAAAD
ncbi:MAG: hypothetical protein DRI90_22550, partial [Deltaproteobacteria bacterium]